MTVSLAAEDIGLVHRIRKQLTLQRAPRPVEAPGGQISDSGRSRLVTALEGVTFSLEAGDRLGLVGSNGAGKTTLLKVLYGVYTPTSGRVVRQGRADALFNIRLGFRGEATGRRNIVLRGLLNGWTPAEIESRMDDIISFSELGEFIDLPMKSYSAGMAARLAFAVATTLDPQILLMDEWIGAGDASFQDKARRRMVEMAEKAGIIVLASHNPNLIRRTCNKVLELEKGRVKSFMPIEDWKAPE